MHAIKPKLRKNPKRFAFKIREDKKNQKQEPKKERKK